MAFFKFTALAIAIDACDVAIIAPRTVGLDTDSTVLMARGQSVLPALTPAEAAAEVDATVTGDPLMAGPYDTLELGDGCFFGGRQVQRIAPTADGLGCVVTFGNVPAVLTVPDVDVDTMTIELNGTGECGGGGGDTSYQDIGEWVAPSLVDTTGTLTFSASPVQAWRMRLGPAGSSAPAAGDLVKCGLIAPFEGTLDDIPVIELSNLPYPLAVPPEAFSYSAPPGVTLLLSVMPTETTITLSFAETTGGPIVGSLVLEFTYRVAAE